MISPSVGLSGKCPPRLRLYGTILPYHNPEGEITMELNEMLNLGSISVELDALTIDDPLAFADMIYKADNFEVYPLTNGKIRFDITFQGVLKSIA